MRRFTLTASCLVLMLSFFGSASAQDANEEVMAEMMRIGTPGDMHTTVLAKMVGTWKAEITMFHGEANMTEKGNYSCEMVMGGRFLKGTYEGESMGHAVVGETIDAYDIGGEKFVSIWFDSMHTGIMVSEGVMKDDHTVVMVGSMYNPETKKVTEYESIRKVSDDHIDFEMYKILDGTKRAKVMTIKYTRTGT